MTRFARLAIVSLFASVLAVALVSGQSSASAAAGFTVSVSPSTDTVAVGETVTFKVLVEGQTAVLPSFQFDVDGGSLAGVASIDPTAANRAEGAVFVTRSTEGTAHLNVRLGNELLASAQARFASMGELNVSVTLDAGIDAAARTWRFEVLDAAGQVLKTLQANTSGDFPTDVVSAGSLPFGSYTVRQLLGNDTRTSCGSGAFYQVVAPGSAQAPVQVSSSAANVSFTIRPCPDLPGLEVLIPIDTVAAAPGVVGDPDFLPGETPVSEVRGARDEGPGNPLPPSVGNSAPTSSNASNLYLLLLVTGAAAILLPVAGWSLAVAKERHGD